MRYHTKTKVNILANHNSLKQRNEPIRTQNNRAKRGAKRGKTLGNNIQLVLVMLLISLAGKVARFVSHRHSNVSTVSCRFSSGS